MFHAHCSARRNNALGAAPSATTTHILHVLEKLRTLSVANKSPKVSRFEEINIVPWWYARLLTILYAEPETYRDKEHGGQATQERNALYQYKRSENQQSTLIFSSPTHMSFRSLAWASTPRERTARTTICAVTCLWNEWRGR